MKDRNKRWMGASIATAKHFAIEAIHFYSIGDITGTLTYRTDSFAFLVIAFGQMKAS